MCLCVLYTCIFVYHVYIVHEDQEKASDSLDLELQKAVSSDVGAGKIWVPLKSRLY